MTVNNYGQDTTMVAAADLSGNQYRAVTTDANGQAAISGAAELIAGIQQDKEADAAGKGVTVRTVGDTRAEYGGNVTAGDQLTTNASGQLVVVAAATDPLVGVALVSGVATQIGKVRLNVSERDTV